MWFTVIFGLLPVSVSRLFEVRLYPCHSGTGYASVADVPRFSIACTPLDDAKDFIEAAGSNPLSGCLRRNS